MNLFPNEGSFYKTQEPVSEFILVIERLIYGVLVEILIRKCSKC